MLTSTTISRRQSEIRQSLAELAGKPTPTEDETRAMETLDAEYRTNETRFRAALTPEDTERRNATGELETRAERDFARLLERFELRQAVLALDEGRSLGGATAEIVTELRAKGGYRGIPIPWDALETRNTLLPDSTLGIQVRISRKVMKQSGAGLEAAIRSDLNGAMTAEIDKAAFRDTGQDGQPLGIVTGAASYGIAETAIDATASAAAFRSAVAAFMAANAATSPRDVRGLLRPETWNALDNAYVGETATTEFDRLLDVLGADTMLDRLLFSPNALAAPTGSPAAASAVLTTTCSAP